VEGDITRKQTKELKTEKERIMVNYLGKNIAYKNAILLSSQILSLHVSLSLSLSLFSSLSLILVLEVRALHLLCR
jgi:hypothetical protein